MNYNRVGKTARTARIEVQHLKVYNDAGLGWF